MKKQQNINIADLLAPSSMGNFVKILQEIEVNSTKTASNLVPTFIKLNQIVQETQKNLEKTTTNIAPSLFRIGQIALETQKNLEKVVVNITPKLIEMVQKAQENKKNLEKVAVNMAPILIKMGQITQEIRKNFEKDSTNYNQLYKSIFTGLTLNFSELLKNMDYNLQNLKIDLKPFNIPDISLLLKNISESTIHAKKMINSELLQNYFKQFQELSIKAKNEDKKFDDNYLKEIQSEELKELDELKQNFNDEDKLLIQEFQNNAEDFDSIDSIHSYLINKKFSHSLLDYLIKFQNFYQKWWCYFYIIIFILQLLIGGSSIDWAKTLFDNTMQFRPDSDNDNKPEV